jgi:hypothetical protein
MMNSNNGAGMRRKPNNSQGGSYSNQSRKPRYQGGGSGGGDYRNQGQNNNRPRKNYPALREKYLAQARDALAAGDRVLAENYFQHAEHCYRMMVEEGYNTRNNYTPPPATEAGTENTGEQQGEQAVEQSHEQVANEEDVVAQLPAFLTGVALPQPTEPVIVQNWEE